LTLIWKKNERGCYKTHESHKPFLELVLHNDYLGKEDKDGNKGRKYSEADIVSWLDGEYEDKLLSSAFELWSQGKSHEAVIVLGALTITEAEAKRITDLQKKSKTKDE